ncbi:hypothetical protein [Haladaptatus sp. DFWS20]
MPGIEAGTSYFGVQDPEHATTDVDVPRGQAAGLPASMTCFASTRPE